MYSLLLRLLIKNGIIPYILSDETKLSRMKPSIFDAMNNFDAYLSIHNFQLFQWEWMTKFLISLV